MIKYATIVSRPRTILKYIIIDRRFTFSILFFIIFIKAYSTSTEGLYDTRSYSLLKFVVFEKVEKGEKIHDWNDLSSLKPAAIRLMLGLRLLCRHNLENNRSPISSE